MVFGAWGGASEPLHRLKLYCCNNGDYKQLQHYEVEAFRANQAKDREEKEKFRFAIDLKQSQYLLNSVS